MLFDLVVKVEGRNCHTDQRKRDKYTEWEDLLAAMKMA